MTFEERLNNIELKTEVIKDLLYGDHGIRGMKENYEYSIDYYTSKYDNPDYVESYKKKLEVVAEIEVIVENALEKYLAQD